MSTVTLATVCMNVVFDKKKNLEKYFRFIDEAAAKNANLIAFPEQSLQGYLHNLGQFKLETMEYQHANAEVVPEGESTQALIAKAKEKNMYIIWGMTERDKERYDVLYNAAVLVGPEGFLGVYRKVHQPLDEKHVYFDGHEWPVFDTKIGKIGMLICYDKSFPESTRELALRGAEILVMPTAWPLTTVGADYKTDYCKYLYDLYDCVRAAENQCFFISSNHVGVSGDHEFFGHSRIVGPNGRVIVETGMQEGLAVATVDVKEQIVKARTIDFLGLCQLKDRKPSTYTMISSPIKESR